MTTSGRFGKAVFLGGLAGVAVACGHTLEKLTGVKL